jgi:hypothetical protein
MPKFVVTFPFSLSVARHFSWLTDVVSNSPLPMVLYLPPDPREPAGPSSEIVLPTQMKQSEAKGACEREGIERQEKGQRDLDDTR